MMTNDNFLYVITGPTASGKTAKAVALAEAIDAEIISADSRQIYRGMDIGTGKDLNEYKSVPYHVILCGGTGLYVESVLKGIELPPVPENKELREELKEKSLTELTEILKQYKTLHNITDVDNCKRAIRAIEIQKYYHDNPALQVKTTPRPVKNVILIGVDIDRENRRKKISMRLQSRLKEGMIDEVSKLLANGVSPESLIYYGLEYKYVTQYVIGELSYEEMYKQLEIAIHQFAKRQMTWFRGMERRGFHINWIPFDLPNDEFIAQALAIKENMAQNQQ